MSRDRYKNTLGTVGCCPFDSPFPAIVVFLSARASTSFLSVLSLTSSFFLALPYTIYDPVVFSYAFNPFFFSFATLGPPTRREENTSRICVRAIKWWRLTRARGRWTLRRFNKRYYDLVALDIVHINPRGTLILENLELSRVPACARVENLLIVQERKNRVPYTEEGWSHASGSDERGLPPRKIKRSVRRSSRNSRP